MHREGGVIEAAKFSLAGNAKAPAASPKKQGAVLVWNRRSDVIGFFSRQTRCRFDLWSICFRWGHISLTLYEK